MIAICIPTAGTFRAGFAMSLLDLVRHCDVKGKQLYIQCQEDSAVHASRQRMAQNAIDHPDVTHVLFLDCDLKFLPTALDRLLEADVPVVAANCRASRGDHPWTAVGLDGKELSSEGRAGVEQARYVGGAMMLIQRDVLEKLERPWFAMDWDGDRRRGTDDYFIDRCHEVCIPVYVHHGVSRGVRHAATVWVGGA